MMGYTIVSGSKPLSVALHQNHAIYYSIYRNYLIKCLLLVLNLNMQRDGTEEPTINNFFKMYSKTV